MKKIIVGVAIVTVACSIIFTILYVFCGQEIFLTLAISFGTTCYHFVMRLLVGLGTKRMISRPLNYNSKWFAPKTFEKDLYQRLRVKNWKDKMPTFYPDNFSMKIHSFDEIIQTMCISEIGHELMFGLSFLPIFLAVPFGESAVFVITSVIAGGIDFVFVIMQRYNRPRLVKIYEKINGKSE